MPYLGSGPYLVTVLIVSIICLAISALLMKESMRLDGAGPWLVFLILGSFASVPARAIAMVSGYSDYALIYVAAVVVVGVPYFHFVMPNLAKDFLINSLAATTTMCLVLGILVAGVAFGFGYVEHFLPSSSVASPEAIELIDLIDEGLEE